MYHLASNTVFGALKSTAAVPALAGAATGTVTITDARITPNSLVFLSIAEGSTTPNAASRANVAVSQRVPAVGSVVIDVRNLHASQALLSTDFVLNYFVIPLKG